MGLASADSLKQRIAAAVNRLNGFENYACHFCQSREMVLQRSVVTTGKRESHRLYGFNSTTVHYTIKANIIPRCARCSDLHTYLWNVSSTVHGALGVALVAGVGFMIWAKSLGGTRSWASISFSGQSQRSWFGRQASLPAGPRRASTLLAANGGTGEPRRRSNTRR